MKTTVLSRLGFGMLLLLCCGVAAAETAAPAGTKLDWDPVIQAIFQIVILSFFLERALSLLFESGYFVARYSAATGIKESIAFLFSLLVVCLWQFDAVSLALGHPGGSAVVGYVVTAAVVAGGSKAAIKLFKDVLGIRNDFSQQQAQELREARKQSQDKKKTETVRKTAKAAAPASEA